MTIGFYLPVLLIFVAVYFLVKKINTLSGFLKFISIATVLTVIYSVILGLYFQNFSFEDYNCEYPSRTISSWASMVLFYIVLPLDICYVCYYYFIKKR